MAKVFVPGKGWLDEEDARQLGQAVIREEENALLQSQSPDTKLANLVITQSPSPPTDEEKMAKYLGIPASERTPYSVTKTMRTGQRGTVMSDADTGQLSDLLDEYKASGYDKYRLSGGQLIDEDDRVMMNATPDDIARYKEYQRAQLMVGANETGGGRGRQIRIEGSAPVRPSKMMLEDMTQSPMFKNAMGVAALEKLQAETEKARRGEVPKAEWGTVESGGKMYQINKNTGEMRPAEVGGEQLFGKKGDTAIAKEDGAKDVNLALASLRDAYDRLETGGGITSTQKGTFDNMLASTSSSGIGQGVGKMLGTTNQSARNEVAMIRPALLAALMKATGMSAKQMDSNAELKLWLSTATDPTLDVQSNRKALDLIEQKYLKSPSLDTSSEQQSPSNENYEQVKTIAGKQYGKRGGQWYPL